MFEQRKALYAQLEKARNSKVLCYVTGDRPNQEAQISADVFDLFVNHLDVIGDVQKISLVLYTRGGDTLTAWSLVNLLRQFCKELEIIIPSKCHSSGTIMCLGANNLVMTKQATLGPIDPSVNTPLNPSAIINGQQLQLPVSVEEINGYLEVVKHDLNIKDDASLAQILLALSEKVHPLVLGKVYRAKAQIQMLARKLLSHQLTDSESIEKIVSFLCSDSGSHDYTINRIEAVNDLGLTVEKPDEHLYGLIKEIYEDFKTEMHLGEPFDPNAILGTVNQASYVSVRSILEAPDTFSYQFRTEGMLQRLQVPGAPGQFGINHNLISEGWARHG
ncbi:SDH family Clp fold serine proteinase [Enterobacter roggenkampii]|uniref:SDH family Clp fold serine proteinase n=1 Tax=Enterobacter roggenkampii TaxID=1812935 RepID=UPI002003F790|nr:serine protease [Enterobacter roggenkampii]MCK7046712.1 serine protease [Enterobacter roggenkampii]